ncbi:DUF2326 domain-containing protein [Anaerococcus lactolyticus]|uniref:DUF2326 domain-containing protein n=1 Tax=Anaerococcus lactolyticus S7-1-13 TaxID=1284686 RepID=A0A095X024_9FIRM|nr:DUF2326 domain-containing protein [Anaerococcus lactolyticus]KGF03405.1 hypothetical protein HMPREF1630_07440 [Anaerococcus lactolyticus S7-1-13]
MFIEKMKISTKYETIRELNFHKGMNLIIDNTPLSDDLKSTGNNVGKTTVLKLIYFCLGGEGKDIYTDEENKNKVYDEVKNFLINQEVLVTLILTNGFNIQKKERLVIQRNFLSGKNAIRKINGKSILKKDFENELLAKIFPEHKNEKPSFKQIISHNIRYKDNSINNTLKTLVSFTSDVEYETLYLYLLGCGFDSGAKKQALTNKIKQDNAYKERIEKNQNKNSYEVALAIIEDEIDELNNKKSLLNINENFEEDLNRLNEIKYKINRISSLITKLEIRRDMIVEAKNEMEKDISSIDLEQLRLLYSESKEYIPNLHKTFEDLVAYHNEMIVEKISFITKELPSLSDRIENEKRTLKVLLSDEKELSLKISKSDSFNDLENIISEINEKYRLKGEYENIISQINEVDSVLKETENELKNIDQYLYSSDFEEKLKKQIKKFNKYFSSVSYELYGEKYALSYEIVNNKKTNKPVYKFSTFNSNMSSGKKQGEILCFDLAYIMFADEEGISCLHFLLNDKKELMHDNQLLNVADFVKKKDIQLVISILKDKLPDDLLNKANIVVELSQEDKLFRIE